MYSKLGKKRKKKQRWRSPKGRDNKMREKRKGRAPIVSIGYKESKNKVFTVNSLGDLEKVKGYDIINLGRVGKKKKIETAKKAKEKKITFKNFNARRFLKKNESGKKEKTS